MPLNEERDFIPVRIAVLTVSDTRQIAEDRSGDTLVTRLTEAGHVLADRQIVQDEQALIEAQLRAWIADADVDVVMSTGGTGLTGRDVTVEAHKAVYEKEIDGFSTAFHMISWEKIGTSTVQSRACAGVAERNLSVSPCLAAPAPVRTHGTASSSISLTINICPATSLKSCHALKSISAANEVIFHWCR